MLGTIATNAQSMSPSTLSMQVARKRQMRGRSCFIDVSDEKVHIGLFGSFHIACNTSHGDVVEQFLALDSHNVHRHLAGNKLYPVVDGLLPERFQGIDSLLLHQVAHHPGADAQHVHLRESQLRTVGGRGHLIELCRTFEKAEMEGKCNSGRRLPMRVDHGMTFTDQPGGVFDESNHGHNAGYTLLGRMFAMGQIQGILATVDSELGIEYKQPGFYD